jgi:hypothetical protein
LLTLPAHLAALRDEALRTSCEGWAIQKRWTLTKGRDRSGPCPKCGGTDRFSINTVKNLFNCRGCGISGEGVIKLVMETEDLEFVAACERITGRKAEAPIDPERAAENARALEEKKRQDDAVAEEYRRKAREAGNWIYGSGRVPSAAGPVRGYLAMRALEFRGIAALDQLPVRERLDLPYVESSGRGGYETLHTGPAMMWPILLPARLVQPGDPLGRFGGVHQTWIDLDQPKGKLVMFDPDRSDKQLPAKKMRGTKQGGMIPIYTPRGARRIVMGEGIETTATPLCHAFKPDTAYWAAGDLGNMAGKAFYRFAKRHDDLPDMADLGCFLVPDWCEELVYLAENDEPEKKMIEKCRRGLLRNRWLREIARRSRPELPPLRCVLVRPDGGLSDMNDVAMDELREAADQPGRREPDGTTGTVGA